MTTAGMTAWGKSRVVEQHDSARQRSAEERVQDEDTKKKLTEECEIYELLWKGGEGARTVCPTCSSGSDGSQSVKNNALGNAQ